MAKSRLPSFGDVITSIKFQYGHLGYDKRPPIQVGADSPVHMVCFTLTDNEVVEIERIVGGKLTSKELFIDLGVPDVSRATAEFVVIENDMQGGGTGMGCHDIYPDGWHIIAKRLDKDGKWNPNGEEIAFYMTGCFIDMIPPEEVKIIRHMAMSLV